MVAGRSSCSHRQAICNVDYQLGLSGCQKHPATHDIGQQTQSSQVPHTGLGRLGLLFTSDHGDQTDVDERKVFNAHSELKLPHGFNKRCRLDVSDSSSEFHDADVGNPVGFINWDSSDSKDPFLNSVGQVRDDLDGLAEVVSFSLLVACRECLAGHLNVKSHNRIPTSFSMT